ncbi:hypothetical protein [Sphaerisporangium fuscum]|uniref:hypothetical protein n=1 Tax=Sphaerisporangium fuscum TaxID=2835868 RepID=UPI001BDC460D|nr:hypothetical protein [Sphaerisporangium fuscum]
MTGVHEALAVIAASARAAYAGGAHLRVRSSGIVHQVAMTRWLGGQLMPGPACMVGVSGWDPGAAHPDRGEVTCRRCLKLHRDESPTDQMELFALSGADDEPEPEQLTAW